MSNTYASIFISPPCLQHTIIPRGSLSLKVLAELPIIVVLMYQVSDIILKLAKYTHHSVIFDNVAQETGLGEMTHFKMCFLFFAI